MGASLDFLDALRNCVAILSHGSHDRSQWQHDAREGVQRLVDALDESQTGGVQIRGVDAAVDVLYRMIDFIHGELTRTYLYDATPRLPASRALLRRMEDFLEDCGAAAPPPSALSKTISPAEGGTLFGVSPRTFVRWVGKGKIRAKKLSTKAYQVAVADLPTLKRR